MDHIKHSIDNTELKGKPTEKMAIVVEVAATWLDKHEQDRRHREFRNHS